MSPDPRQSELELDLKSIAAEFDGVICTDELTRRAYATDASVYQKLPAAVIFPKTDDDIVALIGVARRHKTGLIPRTAGTSLAGQVVGSGMVVDVSRFMNRILEVNQKEKWACVQPGVVRDELNRELAASALFFAPETSTSNRAMIGGMFGNNSCGANSIVYGTTRENVISTHGFLASGEFAEFGPREAGELAETCVQNPDGGADRITVELCRLLSDPQLQRSIRDEFPAASVSRRNTGYAVDRLLDNQPFRADGPPFNLCRLLAGSEGTLFFSTGIKLRLHDLPDRCNGLYCPHFRSVDEATQATQIVMRYPVSQCELIDRLILEGAGRNPEQRQQLHYFSGNPAAVLIVEARGPSRASVEEQLRSIQADLESAHLGYHHPIWFEDAVADINAVRRAGLGVVANVPGDEKPTTVIEDAAVPVNDLPQYIREVDNLLRDEYDTDCIHYGHAGAGELHLRPVLNLKSATGVARFRKIAEDVAGIVKRFHGSLSGEHGDGRLRGSLLPKMIGERNYELLRQIKAIWDPENIFNPGKIVDAPPMTVDLRYPTSPVPEIATVQDFSATGGLLRAAEMCSGVGECRKSHLSGGVMCPSFMATRDEIHSTRARANLLRQYLSETPADGQSVGNPMNRDELHQAMDLCLSCKACKSECPSNVDIAKMKAEFLQAWFDVRGIPLRTRIIANIDRINRWGAVASPLTNWMGQNRFTASLLKKFAGFHTARPLPRIYGTSFRKWFDHSIGNQRERAVAGACAGRVFLFCDEFTNFNDVPVGIAAAELLRALGYAIEMPPNLESGRAAISSGLLRKAQSIANRNVELLSSALDGNQTPLLGIEPSAILTLRDEYPDLVSPSCRARAQLLAGRVVTIDEFLSSELAAGRIDPAVFTTESRQIRFLGHCHQRAVSSLRDSIRILQIPKNYQARIVPAGCCGMAGSFGYEKEHYGLSMKIGELGLFPAIRGEENSTIIAATGTSCRQQILHGTGRKAFHPVQILRQALVVK